MSHRRDASNNVQELDGQVIGPTGNWQTRAGALDELTRGPESQLYGNNDIAQCQDICVTLSFAFGAPENSELTTNLSGTASAMSEISTLGNKYPSVDIGKIASKFGVAGKFVSFGSRVSNFRDANLSCARECEKGMFDK